MSARQKAAGLSLLALWLGFRLALIPADPSVTPAFSHDSAYLSTVARNLLAGRGFVNDAHWLLFLNPARLPMPYHNANPLYPIMSGAAAAVFHLDPAKGGAIVSVCSNALLAFSVFWLVRRFSPSFWLGIAAATAAALWPANFRDSFAILPDALCTACAVATLAGAVHVRSTWPHALVGALLGTAWLARSSALLVLPALALWIYCQDRTRFVARLAWVVAGAGLVASPWLIHTAHVRGSPFASDNAFYWLQEFHAYRTHRMVDQYWHSLTPPPGLGEILRTEPLEFVAFVARGLPTFAHMLLAAASDLSKLGAAALLAAMALASWEMSRRALRSPAVLAAALTGILSIASLLTRPATLEIRYLGVTGTLLAIALLIPFSPTAGGRLPVWGRAVMAACLLIFAVPQNVRILQMARASPEAIAYRAFVLSVRARIDPGAAVITDSPYLFTYFTGLPAISPPYPSKRELLEVMRRYGARYVLLPRNRLEYLYAGAPAALLPELGVDAELGADVLLKLI